MKLTTLLFPLSLLLLAACGDQKETDAKSDPAPAESAAPESGSPAESSSPAEAASSDADASTEKTGTAANAAAASTGSMLDGATKKATAAVAGGGGATESLKEVSGFSDTISKTWDSIKGMDYAKKADFVKQALALVSTAKDKLALLNNISSSLPEGMSKKLMDQVGGISGNIGKLSGLLGKAGSIGSGDWSSYKDQIGSAMSLLGGGFSGLGSL